MRSSAAVLAAALAVALSTPAHGQAATDADLDYRREVFEYHREGRPDPFRSLVNEAEMGVRPEDLALVGVIYDPAEGRSVAVLSRGPKISPLRLRVGQTVGGVRVTAIRPTSVDVVVEDFGIARRETIELKPVARKGETK